jgi:hypothetical protein
MLFFAVSWFVTRNIYHPLQWYLVFITAAAAVAIVQMFATRLAP